MCTKNLNHLNKTNVFLHNKFLHKSFSFAAEFSLRFLSPHLNFSNFYSSLLSPNNKS